MSDSLLQPPTSGDTGPEARASWWARVGGRVRAFPPGFRALALPFRPDALHHVSTDDGARIALARYLPRGARRFREPVVLCHGLGANRYSFDLDERHSLARRLAERGFETFILELRGRGEAGPAARTSFDRQATWDVAAALRFVGAGRQVLWVGHSKGGMVALAHLAKNPAAPLRAIAALGSPTDFSVQGLGPFARVVRPLLAGPAVPIQNLSRLALVVPPPGWFMRYLVRPENMDPVTRRKALFNVGADVAGGVGRQFLRWLVTRRWTDEQGTFDYARGLKDVRIPLLLISGAKDLLAPPVAVAHTATCAGGPCETFVAGRETGLCEDYGHGDLLLGRRAPEELYPKVAAFLERVATPA